MLLISIGSLGYASLNGTVTAIACLENANYQIKIAECCIVDYKGFGPEISCNEREVNFNDTIFPGWELKLNTTIHNNVTESTICKLNCTISYWNETIGWVVTDESELFELFKIQYSGVFYNATTNDPIEGDPILTQCESVFHIDHFIFDPTLEEYEEMLCQTFLIRIQIFTNPPNDPEGGT